MRQKQIDAIVAKLKSKGLRVTPQRFAVYADLLSRSDHPTVEQILKSLNQSGPISSQATVYSSLQALKNAGLVREVLLEPGISRYDANIAPHHHFRCNLCGSIEDLSWDTFSEIDLQNVPSRLQVDSYEVVIRGRCDRCQND